MCVKFCFKFSFLDTKYISGTEPLREYFSSTVLSDLNRSLEEQSQIYTTLGNLFISICNFNH